MRFFPLFLLAVLLAAGCVGQIGPSVSTVELRAADGTRIVGDYYDINGTRAVILLHALDSDRRDWTAFALNISRTNWTGSNYTDGWSVLAVDLRGHGDSDGDWHAFGNADFASMPQDVAAAKAFLKSQGKRKMVLIGASMGANLALMGGEGREVKGVIALSPGLDYRGLRPETASAALSVPVMLVAGEDDASSTVAVQLLNRTIRGATSVLYPGAGHGTRIFAEHPGLTDIIISWLGDTIG